MNVAVCLLAYALTLTVLGPVLLSRATRNGAAPRLGVSAWLAAMGGVIAAAVGALVFLVSQVVLGARGASALRHSLSATRDHARAARIAAGDAPPGPEGALVVDSARRGVYCPAGRPHTIVITRGALAALDDAQLGAVLAHERAHLNGRHHQLLTLTGALSAMLPGVRLFSEGAADIARLPELCADDVAAGRHGPDTVVDALLALTLPGSLTGPAAPATALSASGVGVTERVKRLLYPPDLLRDRAHLALVFGVVLVGPVLTVGLMIAAPSLCAT